MLESLRRVKSRGSWFYGWVMLGVAIAMAFASMPGQTVLVSLWKEPLRASLGLSLTSVSAAYSIGTIVAALPLSLVGRVADRLGLRVTVGAVAAAFAVSLVLLREATGIVTLGVGFLLVRFLGQGSLGMLSGHTVAMWFERRLGTAHALLTVGGFAAGQAIMAGPTAWMLVSFGWRTTLLILAGMVAALVLPAVALVFRNRPEDVGQHLDGDPAAPAEDPAGAGAHDGGPRRGDPAFTVGEAMRTPAYWILLLTMVSAGFVGTALIFHMGPMLEQAGLEGSAAEANPTIARYFGRTHHGAIRGTVATATVMGTGGGPYLVALGRDLAGGNFGAPILACVALAVPLGIGAALLRKPARPGAG